MRPGRRSSGDLWAIASYFNPAGYRSRIANYRTFHERLSVPLVTVELAFANDFELGRVDADVLVQLRARDVIWQKERLLNVALASLPPQCRAVAWLDCDVVFERDDWAEAAVRMLDGCVLLQPFHRAVELPRGVLPEQAACAQLGGGQPSFAYYLSQDLLTPEVLASWRINGDRTTLRDGYAWVGHRDALERHGFYDARVVGGSTRDLACAALGAFEPLIDGRPMTGPQREHLLAWASPFYESVRGRIGYLDGAIYHLWHGDLAGRGYTVRHSVLHEFQFDPYRDIALDEDGCWRWSSDKPEMHAFVREYFEGRKEDG